MLAGSSCAGTAASRPKVDRRREVGKWTRPTYMVVAAAGQRAWAGNSRRREHADMQSGALTWAQITYLNSVVMPDEESTDPSEDEDEDSGVGEDDA